ncbi:unnamed protein product [Triticum turgidum subsp. durum]|uniref:Glycosyltransferase n=1 Tax=Triticum turgidum subsp. durum TaxID=4567 RepID=A0A9R1AJB5_TRITD|nr:unnamed protein product [Triticum turgidum subsp. durum]
MADAERQQHGRGDGGRPHFLIVAYGIQSHLNPCRVLARRLVQLHDADGSGPVLATLSVPLFTHRRMFPSSGNGEPEGAEAADGAISCVPFSDGVDDGTTARGPEERARRRRASAESLFAVVARLASCGRPVTCIMCSMMLPWALDVAREHAIPLAFFWIQPATVLATYYHYFHGYGELIASHAADPAYELTLPGLSRPLRIRDFPSFLVDTTGGEVGKVVNAVFCELFEFMDEQRRNVKVLVNTFDELEPAALAAMREHMDLFAVGPVVGSSAEPRIHLFNHAGDDKLSMFDQPTNAMLIEEEWAAGVSNKRNGEGIFSGPELARCVELVMGDGARAVEVRKKVESLKGMARDAMAPGGPAERNLRSFVMEVQSSDGARRKDTNTISPQP